MFIPIFILLKFSEVPSPPPPPFQNPAYATVSSPSSFFKASDISVACEAVSC